MEEKSETKRSYELSFLLLFEEASKEVLAVLARSGAEVTYESPLASLRLAYPIKKQTSAFFGFIHFFAEGAVIRAVTDELKLKPGVLRTLLITPPPASPTRMSRPMRTTEVTKPTSPLELTNEALEQKLEEILK